MRDTFMPLDLLGDKLRIQQVLTNLVGNAIKFTGQGSVRLELTLQNISKSQVQLLFSVTDTGIGIAPQDLSKLFLEFSQVDGSFTRKYGGTGLGLVISKELVELMGGEISVESTKDQGSNFSFSLLFDIDTSSNIHTSHSAPKILSQLSPPISNRFKGYTALVVEDNESIRRLLTKQLLKFGIACVMTNNGEEALSMLEQQDFDIVLMDIHMPVMNGIEATNIIRSQEKYAHLPIIALTAGITELERNNCTACGINDFITKPVNKDKLSEALELWLKTSKVE
jgi:CheY-like chemotaxis protein